MWYRARLYAGLCTILLFNTVLAYNAPFLEQSFFFDWNQEDIPYPVPVTEQCETIQIKWSQQRAPGPNPVGPYYLQVYTSEHTVPIVIPVGDVLSFNLTIPFKPGTLYQICMFDKNGNTGGCQDTYTVIPPQQTPTCLNTTLPFLTPIEVEAVVFNGPLSRYGWIDQCTDISVRPKNGTAPYTMTIAPALHPPANITSNGNSLNWTVSLSWSAPFFISVVDSQGRGWANGLLHSGSGASSSCLSTGAAKANGVSRGLVAGVGVGGFLAGLALTILAAFFYLRYYGRHPVQFPLDKKPTTIQASNSGPNDPEHQPLSNRSSHPSNGSLVDTRTTATPSHGRFLHPGNSRDPRYLLEPFDVTPESSSAVRQPPSPSAPSSSDASHPPVSSTATQPAQVYVVHHDGGRPPVTVYTAQGAEVVELPPRYSGSASPVGINQSGDPQGLSGSVRTRSKR